MKIKKKITGALAAAALVTASLIGAAVIAPAANAAPACLSENEFKLNSDKFGSNQRIYTNIPCNFTSKQESLLLTHMEKVAAYVNKSNTYGYMTHDYVYNQGAAKKTLMEDLSTYTIPFTHLGGKTFNTATLKEIQGYVNSMNSHALTISRMSHVYKVLFFTEAYLEHETSFADPAFHAEELYEDVTSAYSLLTSEHILYEATSEVLEVPSFDSIYTTFFSKMKGVVDQMEYSALLPTYDERIGTALTD